ncbi:hypothetical protein V8C44DRAFT_357218 [Trichoderma aethiopicum]
MASLGPPPPGIDLHESRAADLVASWASTWSLAVVSVMLRVVCRRLAKVRFWLDDWFIITSLFFSGGFMFTVTIYMVDNGMCRHIWAGPADATRDWALGLFTTEFTYTLSLVFIKWSVLAFYWRIFSIQFLDKLCLWILAGMVACWGVAAFDPVHPTDPDTFNCGVDIHNLFIGKAVPHIVTDALILVFPLPYIWHLHLRLSQKIATAGIFLVGIFVSIVSIVRFVFVLEVDLDSPDVTWDQCSEMLWTGIEIYIGTVCACLPSLKPLLNLVLYGSVYPRSHRPTASDAQVMFEIAEAAKRRCRQPSNTNVSSSYISASARGAVEDERVSDGLSESVTGSVPDDSPTIEMDDVGEHTKDCR